MDVVRWLLRRVSPLVRAGRYVTNVAVLADGVGGQADSVPGVSIRVSSANDAPALAPFVAGRESLAWRFARDDIVLVAEVGGQVVGCTWLTNLPLRPFYLPIAVCPGPGAWYDYGLVILPRFRGRGIGRALSRRAMAEARSRGGQVLFGHAKAWDQIAAASHAAAGFVSTEELWTIILLNRFVVVLYRRPLTAPKARAVRGTAGY
jgi:GNAT superfamily N-acetyltransferase